MWQNVITLTPNTPRGRPPGLMKGDKLGGGFRLGAVVLLHGGDQEPNEAFHTRWELIPKSYVASTHVGTNYANLRGLE